MKVVIENGTVLNGTGAAPQPNTTLLVEDKNIVDIGSDIAIPDDAKIIDAQGKTVMPGLIDAHLHLKGVRSMNPIDWVIEPVALKATRGVVDAKKLIEAGFTAVRCASSDIGVSLNTAIEEGTIPGPRIIASNYSITQTGGHSDRHMLPIEWVTGHYCRIADGVSDCRKAAREQIRAGARVIKVCTTGGVYSEKDSPTQAQFVDEEIAAITTEAHRVGIKVMSHAQSPEGIQTAIRNGVDTIEHAIYLDDETIQMLLKYNTIVVPTFAIVYAIVTKGEAAGVPEYGMRKAKEAHKAHIESIKMAYKAGVKIAMGTDYVGPKILPHGENAIELEIMVKQVGMTPMEAIVAATRTGAEALGLEKEIGTLAVGRKADLLVVDGDPLADITILQNTEKILTVMKDGQIEVDRH